MAICFSIELLPLPLRYAWRLSRNTSTEKTNLLVRASQNGLEGLGEAAPNIRYHETPERLLQEFESIQPQLNQDFSPESWGPFLSGLPISQALKFGLDLAFQHLQARKTDQLLPRFLGLKGGLKREICYTIPVMEPEEIRPFFETERLDRFSWIKVKVNRELALPMLKALADFYQGPIAVDGNEAWNSAAEVLDFLHHPERPALLFLEQPLPAALRQEYLKLKPESPVPIWGDESVLYTAEPEFWCQAFSGINVKLMKAGSLSNANELLQTARAHGLQTMVGCMVETSIGISAALALESLADYMDLDGFLVLKTEPFGWVSESEGIVYRLFTA
jgi:L-alanine-DL-glutamate epimerase-like enolase superfamily enzyme